MQALRLSSQKKQRTSHERLARNTFQRKMPLPKNIQTFQHPKPCELRPTWTPTLTDGSHRTNMAVDPQNDPVGYKPWPCHVHPKPQTVPHLRRGARLGDPGIWRRWRPAHGRSHRRHHHAECGKEERGKRSGFLRNVFLVEKSFIWLILFDSEGFSWDFPSFFRFFLPFSESGFQGWNKAPSGRFV